MQYLSDRTISWYSSFFPEHPFISPSSLSYLSAPLVSTAMIGTFSQPSPARSRSRIMPANIPPPPTTQMIASRGYMDNNRHTDKKACEHHGLQNWLLCQESNLHRPQTDI